MLHKRVDSLAVMPIFASPYSPLFREMDGEASEMVVEVGEETESAMVGGEDVADEQQAKSLPLGFGGEKRREKMGSHRR